MTFQAIRLGSIGLENTQGKTLQEVYGSIKEFEKVIEKEVFAYYGKKKPNYFKEMITGVITGELWTWGAEKSLYVSNDPPSYVKTLFKQVLDLETIYEDPK